MTIIATAPMPVSLRLDAADTLTQITLSTTTCPQWCTDGPHDLNDESTRLHVGAEKTLIVRTPVLSEPVEVVFAPEWLEGSGESPAVHVGLYEVINSGACVAEMRLTADEAELMAAQLVTMAVALRAAQGGAR